MLRGHARAKVDSKGRLKIPAEFLEPFLELSGDARRVFVTSRDGKRALVYPLSVWQRHERKILEIPTTVPQVEAYVRTTGFWGRESGIDANGRILIHPLLREWAGVNGDVSIFGRQEILEVCNFEMFRHQPPVMGPEELAALSQYGI